MKSPEWKKEQAQLLRDAAREMYDQEYSSWYNANTMRSFEEWGSGYTKSLIERLNTLADEIEESEE